MASGVIKQQGTVQTISPFYTSKHVNISAVERASLKKFGKVCLCDLTFTVSTAISGYTEVLFSGLPSSAGSTRFRCQHGYDAAKPDLVLAVTDNGTIVNQWSQGGITEGAYQCQFVYMCQ